MVLSQNYFTLRNKIYQPEKCVSMGSPISKYSCNTWKTCIQNNFLTQKNILFYTRYVDDILIIYDTKRIHPAQARRLHLSA